MNFTAGGVTILAVCLATVVIGVFGLRFSRTTSDFYVASRTVSPWWNASAIGGEYLSAASYLGIVGLILISGANALWFPLGYTAGYLMLLLFVAAPLRRSGAYTIPDFAEFRLQSRLVRRVTSVCVILICWLYIVPQLHGASLAVSAAAGLPGWIGPLLVAGVVGTVVITGGMRSITFVQAFQFWLKFTALAVPAIVLLIVLAGRPDYSQLTAQALSAAPSGNPWQTVSLIIGLLLGTLGLPHVLVRFYTNPDGGSARRTTLIVLVLVSVFYLFPTLLGVIARTLPEAAGKAPADAVLLELPALVLPGPAGQLLSTLILAGAFAAFLSSSSGLVVSFAGVVSQDLFGGSIRGFRLAALLGVSVPMAVALSSDSLALAGSIGAVFAFTASTLCPLLLLGIWWRGLTDIGAIFGMAAGAGLCAMAFTLRPWGALLPSPLPDLVEQPALLTVPFAFGTMIVVSWLSRHRVSPQTSAIMARLHTPEGLHRSDQASAEPVSRSRP
ncbi:cation acetate symporter [Acaricomes phytoseiuli]|uniref:sodium/solute symporter n=1 Tax=Acaricomes phytoseiuli TaxID=291968 RepID=UPI0003603AC5|nr:cation acetate symporter [Acaricomes phytoseiuli]